MSTSEIVIILGVSCIAALIKSTTGMGYPLVLLPALALFIDVAEAIAIVAPSNLVLNGQLTWKMRERHSEAITLPRFLAGAGLGAIVGTALLPVLPDRGLRVVLIAVIVLFLANRISPRAFAMSHADGQRLAPAVGTVAGLFQGAAGISGPIVTPWFLSLNVARDAYIYAVAMVFALSGVLQIGVLSVQGAFTVPTLLLGLSLIPVAFAIFPLGAIVRDRISVVAFERIVLVLLAVSALSLLVKVL